MARDINSASDPEVPPDEPVPDNIDELTGQTPVGPVDPDNAGSHRGNWGLAARWFIAALLALTFAAILAYFSR